MTKPKEATKYATNQQDIVDRLRRDLEDAKYRLRSAERVLEVALIAKAREDTTNA